MVSTTTHSRVAMTTFNFLLALFGHTIYSYVLALYKPLIICFTHILEQALYHIGHCYMERKMNTDVVVELTHVGDLIGLIEHPALRCFERCIERMSLNSNPISIRYRYSRVNGF